MFLQALSVQKWYRQFRGGIWWRVDLSPDDIPIEKWTNVFPGNDARIVETEDYSCKLQDVFPETEFYEKIVNIARNGEWRDEYDLEKYLRIAKNLRQRGLEDILIIEWLTALYVASSREQTSGLPLKRYSQKDVQDLLELGRTLNSD